GSTTRAVDCEVLQYSMEDVPAFETDGEFMLSPENYRSRLAFELAEYRGFDGQGQKFTQSWEDVDKEFRTDKDIGGQLRKRNYFERNVPLDLISGEGDALSKARGIHQFVKAHYSWNG